MAQRKKGKHGSIPSALMTGSLASIVVMLICTAIVAALLDKEILEESGLGYAAMGILMVSSYLGALISRSRTDAGKLVACLATGGVYLGVLLAITAIFYDGLYRGVGVSSLLILCGSMLAIMSGFRSKRGGKRKIHKIANR